MTLSITLPGTFLDALPADQRGEAEAVAQAWMGFLPGMERAIPAAQACKEEPAVALLAMLDGAVALAQGRHGDALALLEPVRGWFPMAGGSDAQAQILDQMLLVAARGCGRRPLVEQLVARLRADRPQLTPLDRHWLSRC